MLSMRRIWNIHKSKKNLKKKISSVKSKKKFKLKLPKKMDKTFGAADPFLYKKYIFAEITEKNSDEKGVIAVSKISETLKFKTIINKKYHLSYPHVFDYNGKLYMIPESYKANKLQLFRCVKFPYKWELARILKKNIHCCDTTFFKLNNTCYLFTTITEEHDNYIFKTNDILKGELKIECKNILPKGYRGGGNVFMNDGELYIPIQPFDVEFYGEKLYLYKIKLNKKNKIKFKFVREIKAPKGYVGIHHLSNYNDTFIFDTKSVKEY